ncbi:MAG TPA: MFS transporter [Vineibacter sp.]|nr:MFS transporter [Vineibacter sp.]
MTTLDAAAARPRISPLQANYCLILLMLAQALNFLDRGIINILLESIKKDMALSDTMMGFLSGFAFVLFYSIFGIPVARLADIGSRRTIISLGLLVWSAMTAISGLAQNVVQLAMARFGVGIGEAAGQAPAHSMISDYFPKEKRARALTIFQAGAYIGTFLGYFIGGWVDLYYGWRVAFAVAGLPGIALAIVLYLTVAEPPRGQSEATKVDVGRTSFADAVRFLLSQKAFVLTVFGGALLGFDLYAFSVWLPAFLGRVHHLNSGEIGTYAGIVRGACGPIGLLLGGFVVERLSARSERWQLWAPAITSALACPVLLYALHTDSLLVSIVCFGVSSVLLAFHMGPIFAVVQATAKPRMRALATASFYLVVTVVGLGIAPLIIGIANDHLRPTYGAVAIRYSLMLPAVVTVLGGALFWWAAQYIQHDVKRAEASRA